MTRIKFILIFTFYLLVNSYNSRKILHKRRNFIKGIAQNLLSVIITSSSILLPSNAIEYLSPDSSFTINYPEDFKISEKILGFTVKTHDFEVFMKSVNTKGYNAGVTVDKVKINSIREFTSPEELGKKVLDVEIKKDADWYAIEPRNTRMLEAKETITPQLSYFLNYQVDSSRGFKHYLVKTAVNDHKLYIFTIQCDENDYNIIKPQALKFLNTFTLLEIK